MRCQKFFCWKKIFVGLFMLAGVVGTAEAGWLPDGANVAYGWGEPNNLKGYRVAVQWYWPVWLKQYPINITGYWDLSGAYWGTDGNKRGQNKSIGILGFAPVFRFESRDAWFATIKPYIELSVGLALLSEKYIGRRNLGAQWLFQDLLGGGITFGKRNEFDLSYHYLHYSNASFNPPNQGIDVHGLVTLGYKFS